MLKLNLSWLRLVLGIGFAAALATSPHAQDAPTAQPAAVQAPQDEYRITPFDKVTIKVFGQPDLSVEKTQIDASGNLDMPLIGSVVAVGKTPRALGAEIKTRLGERYLQSPSVSVMVDEAVGERVTVTGAVVESGVYNLKGSTTLIQAIALAKGPDTKVADLKRVAVIRVAAGQRQRAIFDVAAIRAGKAPDPEVIGGDTIIVATSGSKQVWRELVGALPAIGTFSLF